MPLTPARRIFLASFLVFAACSSGPESGTGVTASNHGWFPVGVGTTHEYGRTVSGGGTLSCDLCHPSQTTFADFTCTSCHDHSQGISDQLHVGVTGYGYGPQTCLACHPDGSRVPFHHNGITGQCAVCHAEGAPFAAFPANHIAISSDCGGCHTTTAWRGASAAPSNSFDPARSVTVTAEIPSYAGTSIVMVTKLGEILPMVMNHSTTQVPAATMNNCFGCHPGAKSGGYFPGSLHTALDSLNVAQPTGCSDCHRSSAPTGFVGPTATNPVRNPASPEMKHDAVAWDAGTVTGTPLANQDCGVCHLAPADGVPNTWADGPDGGVALFHPSLASAQQPGSCLDCHANSRPGGMMTQANVVLDGGLAFDHSSLEAMGDCGPCHSRGGATQWTSWANGVFHQTGSSSPATCLPCHEGERPTSTATWKSGTYTNSPFDYAGSADGGISHGNGEDCVVCHAGPGDNGVWGSTQNWVGGTYAHGPNASSSYTCLPCHATQRPDLVGVDAGALPGHFDHATSGNGDCYGCHQATVVAGRYVNYNPVPGGDWKDGQTYPGSVLVASIGQFVKVTEIALTRNANKLVTGMTSSSATLNNAMLHTSTALPRELDSGVVDNPNYDTCWHCHTNVNGQVTNYGGGFFHKSLTDYTPDAGGTAVGLPQPTTCVDCHRQMRPLNIVEKAASSLVPMDHAAKFTAAVVLGGASVTSVDAIECAVCHAQPGVTWSDGQFHAKIGAAVPADCTGCHYPLMADAAKADVASTPVTGYVMKHRSGLLTIQACETCHTSWKAKSTTTPLAVTLWQPGTLHATVPVQPTACNDCHTVSTPAGATQSSTTYILPKGGTATNGGQWMSHGAASVVGKDCVVCHAADAKTSNSAWSKSLSFHAATPTGVTTCNACHGGASPNNNLPSGLTDSTTVTTSSASPGVLDQLTHVDVNVSKFECNFCHTQVGTSTTAGVQGKEWAKATFHRNFTASNPLVMNGTTGRCSTCHMNVKPGAAYTKQDHSAYTAATSTQDCAACHTWPGTSSATPNWLGAAGAHAATGTTAGSTLDCNSCHGQAGTASVHLAVAAASHYGGVSNGNSCISCHVNFAGFKGTTTNLLYAHTNGTANSGGCVTCHAFVSQVYTTLTATPPLSYPIAAGGHTFSQTRTVTGTFEDKTLNDNHTAAKMTSCGACHQYSSTTAATNIWAFKHRPSNPGITNKSSSNGCNECH